MFGLLHRRDFMSLSFPRNWIEHIETEDDLKDVMSTLKIHNTNQNVNDESSTSASFSSLVNNTGEECVESCTCNNNGTKVDESLEHLLAHWKSMARKRKAATDNLKLSTFTSVSPTHNFYSDIHRTFWVFSTFTGDSHHSLFFLFYCNV